MTENTPTGPKRDETGTGQGAWPPAAGQVPSGGHAPDLGPPASEHPPTNAGQADTSSQATVGGYASASRPTRPGDSAAPGEYGWPREYAPPGGHTTTDTAAGQYAGPAEYGAVGGYPPEYGAPGERPPFAGGGAPPAVRSRSWARGLAGLGVAAVVGGVVGGGTVALVDHNRNGSAASAASVQRSDATAPSQPASADGTVAGAAAAIEKSVVTIAVRASDGSGGTGSGVILRSDGYILTNDHVVSAAGSARITVKLPDGRTASAKVTGRDPSTDLAVIKVDGVSGLTPATFADSSKLQVGQTVVAVGSPLGLDETVTSGIVSALHRATRAGVNDSAVIDAVQTDAAINPGNSGGALVNLNGQLVGINTSIATVSGGSPRFGQAASGNIGIGFAIPSNTAANIADQLIAHGAATHAYLGVQVSSGSSTDGTSTSGGMIASVAGGGPGAQAGLRAGDVVVKVGDRAIGSGDDLVAAIRSYRPGDKVTLTVQRGGSTSTVTVTLGSDARQ